MVKINIALLFALVTSGLLLVSVQHENRMLFSVISKELTSETKLKAEQKKLELKKQNVITPTLISEAAKKKLDMSPVSIGVTLFIPKDEGSLVGFKPQLPELVFLGVEEEKVEQGGGHE